MPPYRSLPGASGVSGLGLADPASAGRWGDLRLRIASAVVLAPLGLGAIWVGGWWFAAIAAAVGVGIAWEWARMCRRRAPALILGFGYVACAVAGLVWLRGDIGAGRSNVVFLVLVVWASDIGAYATGRWVGGAKLAPAISPGKTWSGAAGGLIAAILVGVAGSSAGGYASGGFLAGGLGLVAQSGDLAESALKRHFGVKDSGALIPGHGGLLDRLDGLLAVAGVATIIAALMGRGVRLWQ